MTAQHSDLDVFMAIRDALRAAMADARARADARGPHGRRFAVLHTAIEAAWLQARQGIDEAQHADTRS